MILEEIYLQTIKDKYYIKKSRKEMTTYMLNIANNHNLQNIKQK
jgi:ferritin-like metal-binding protein YciE